MITETNDWKTILGWLIAEKPVECKGDDGEWVEPDWVCSDAAYRLVTKSDGWVFRLKPRTVKIGSREVEAPVLEPEDGQTLWLVDNRGWTESFRWSDGNYRRTVGNGRAFASEAAALAAHAAYTELLRGDA